MAPVALSRLRSAGSWRSRDGLHGRRGGLGFPAAHRRRPSRNRSSSRWRRCSRRTRPRPSSSIVSRTRSYGRSSGASTSTVRPSTRAARPAAVRRAASASAPSSTSTPSVPVRSVKEAIGAARSSRPSSMASRKEQTRSISPSRWRRDHRGDPELGAGALDQVEHLVAAGRIQAVGRLVQQQQLRVVDQRLGQLDPLLHAGRIAADRPVALLVQANVAQHLGGALARGRRRAGPTCGPCASRSRWPTGRAAGSRAPAGSRRTGGSPGPCAATSRPITEAEPLVGSSRPSRILRSVLLPAPLAPTRPMIPGSTSSVRESSAVTCAP